MHWINDSGSYFVVKSLIQLHVDIFFQKISLVRVLSSATTLFLNHDYWDCRIEFAGRHVLTESLKNTTTTIFHLSLGQSVAQIIYKVKDGNHLLYPSMSSRVELRNI